MENLDIMNELTSYGASSKIGDEDKGINVILESESWRFMSDKAHIGIFNKSQDPDRQYTLKVTELKDHEMLPVELRDKFIFFDGLYSRQDASQISQQERNRINVCDKTEFTYGEVLFSYFIPLLELAKP